MNNKQETTPLKSLPISIAIIVIIISIMTALYINTEKQQQPTAFFARSINDASYDCEAKIDKKFDGRLINKHYDAISSRYEADRHQYIIYYRISIRETEDEVPAIKDYLAKCIVWEKLGYVSEFQIIDAY